MGNRLQWLAESAYSVITKTESHCFLRMNSKWKNVVSFGVDIGGSSGYNWGMSK